MKTRKTTLRALLVALAFLPLSAMADSGFYMGASFGNAGVDTDFGGIGVGDFDEDDSAIKAVIGYRFDLPAVFLAVEGSYIDMGEPEVSAGAASLSIDPTGINLAGIAGIEAGPVELFGKLGYLAWDTDIILDDGLGNVISGSDDGSDLGYGIGIAFGLGPISVRGEYEVFDIEDADIDMISVGFTYLFD